MFWDGTMAVLKLRSSSLAARYCWLLPLLEYTRLATSRNSPSFT